MNKFQYLLLPLSFSARSICSACLVAGGPACALYFVLPRPARWMFDRSGLVVLSRGTTQCLSRRSEGSGMLRRSERAKAGWLGRRPGVFGFSGPLSHRWGRHATPVRHAPPLHHRAVQVQRRLSLLGASELGGGAGDSSPRREREPATFRDLVLTQSSPR